MDSTSEFIQSGRELLDLEHFQTNGIDGKFRGSYSGKALNLLNKFFNKADEFINETCGVKLFETSYIRPTGFIANGIRISQFGKLIRSLKPLANYFEKDDDFPWISIEYFYSNVDNYLNEVTDQEFNKTIQNHFLRDKVTDSNIIKIVSIKSDFINAYRIALLIEQLKNDYPE